MKKLRSNLDIAKYLSKLIKRAYKKCSKMNIKVNDKNKHDLVTTLDTSIEKYIIQDLDKNFHGVKIVSEEFNTEVKAEGTYFVIDPIDGTVNFANGITGLWGVQCAYVENDVLIASALYLPEKANYYAGKNFGAFKNDKKFTVIKKEPLHSLICLEISSDKLKKEIENNIYDKILKTRYFAASCADLTYMAEGSFGGMIISDNNPWDILPGILLMEESGCYRKTYYGLNIFASSAEILNILQEGIEKSLPSTRKNDKLKTKAAEYN